METQAPRPGLGKKFYTFSSGQAFFHPWERTGAIRTGLVPDAKDGFSHRAGDSIWRPCSRKHF